MRRSFAVLAAVVGIVAFAACSGDDGGSKHSNTDTDSPNGNAAPTVSILRPAADTVVAAGDSVQFTGSVTDDRDPSDALTVVWTSDRRVLALFEGRPSAAGNTTFDTDALEPGAHVITLSATDTEGRVGAASVVITVNEAPGAPGVTITPAAPSTADNLVAAVTTDAVDPNRASSALTYRYRWFKDGVFADLTTPTVASALTARGQVWEVRVEAFDGLVAGTVATASVTIGNAAPTCTAASLFPTAADTTKDLTCTCTGWEDLDGDAPADHCAFFDGETPIADHDGSCVLPAALTARGMEVRCVHTPSDGTDDGTAYESSAVPILNAPPTAPTVVLAPEVASALTEMSCTLGAPSTDADGDSISYAVAWVLNGFENSGVATPTVVAGALVTATGAKARKGDRVSCRLRASDGAVTSAPAASAEVVLSNAPPEVGPVLIMPTGGAAVMNELAVLSCETSGATDPDGDDVTFTYSWTVNGEVVPGADAKVLDGASFDRGDVVACTITASDGQDSGEPTASKSPVTIKNAPPSLLGASVTPAHATPYTLLTCTPEGWSDPDGDALEVSTVWYAIDAGGTPTVLAGEQGGTFTPSNLVPGDQVYCVVTPRNGADVGAAVESAPVTLVAPSPTAPVVVVAAPEGAAGVVRCDFVTPAMFFPSTPSYSYFWSVNGAPEASGGASITGLTDCDLVACRAVATAGETVLSSEAAELLLPVGEDCETGEICRTPTCVSGGGCGTLAANAVACEDGNPCTLGDHCDFGTCVQETMAGGEVSCDDGLFCTPTSSCNGQGQCVGAGDTCDTGAGSCVVGSCDEAQDRCDYTPKANDTVCSDGTGCTIGDVCHDGACIPGVARDCSDVEDPCHVGTCSSDDEETFTCTPTPKAPGAPCEHTDFCIVDATCDAVGLCSGGAPRDCQAEAGDACHIATCDSAEAVCKVLTSPDGTACDDEDPCTQFDTCRNGACFGPDKVCIERPLSIGATASFGPVVAPLGSGRYVTQWYGATGDAAGGMRFRRTAAFRSREESETRVEDAFTSYPEAVHGRWETRMGVNRAGDYLALVMAVEESADAEVAHFGAKVWDYLGAQLASNGNAFSIGTAPRDVPLTEWALRTVPVLTTDDTFGVVFGARWSGGTLDTEVVTPADAQGILYAPPTALGTFGTLRTLVAPSDTAPGVLAFDAASLEDGTGDFVVVWAAPDGATLRVRRFSQVGIPRTPTWTELAPRGAVSGVRVASLGDGKKALVIEQPGGVDGDGTGLFAAVLGADNTLVGSWSQVAEGFYGDQRLGEVAAFDDGGFVVAYDDQYGDTEGYGVFAQLFDASGAPFGSALVVNTRKSGDQLQPFVTILDTQEFVVAFRDGTGYVWTRRYKRDGEPSVARPELRINATTPAAQTSPSAAAMADGTVLVAYTSPVAGRSDTEVLARIVDPFGVEEVPEMMINVADGGDQNTAMVGAGPDRFVVGFLGASDTRARLVDPEEGPIGNDIVMHDQRRQYQVAMSPTDGRFLLATTRSVSGGRGGIVRLFDANGAALTGYTGLPGTLMSLASVAAHPLGEGYAVATTNNYGTGVYKVSPDGVPSLTGTPPGYREPGQFAIAFATDGAQFMTCQPMNNGTTACQRFSWATFGKLGSQINFSGIGRPAMAWLDDSRFVLGWASTDSSGAAVQVGRYLTTGAKDKPTFVANLTWEGAQGGPFVVKALATDYLVGWHSFEQDGSSYAIIMRLFPGY